MGSLHWKFLFLLKSMSNRPQQPHQGWCVITLLIVLRIHEAAETS